MKRPLLIYPALVWAAAPVTRFRPKEIIAFCWLGDSARHPAGFITARSEEGANVDHHRDRVPNQRSVNSTVHILVDVQ
jgi:hypothetical protein